MSTGLARTEQCILSSATIMLGPREDLYRLNPTDHSIGLAKSFSLSTSPEFNDLKQGLTNETFLSVRTGSNLECSAEAYEFTAKNLSYASGLDGTTVTADNSGDAVFVTSAPFNKTATTLALTSPPTGVSEGDTLSVYVAGSDVAHVIVAGAITGNSIAVAEAYRLDGSTTFTIPAGSSVRKMAVVNYGGTSSQPTFAMRVTGVIPANDAPVILNFPKVRITQGLAVSLDPGTWANLPMTFMPEALRVGDPNYERFPGNKLMEFLTPTGAAA